MRNCSLSFLLFLSTVVLSLLLGFATSSASIFEVTPAVKAGMFYDDNLDFNDEDLEQRSDYGYQIRPKLRLAYLTDLMELSAFGIVDILKYFEETDFDRTNQYYGGRIEHEATTRTRLFGAYRYTRDETTDLQYQSTGRITRREPVVTQRANAGFEFDITELTFIQPRASYRNTEYIQGDSIDYERYTFELPIKFRLKNQLDVISLNPSYSRYENDVEDIYQDFRMTLGWFRGISEQNSFDVQLGGRYTITENADGLEDDNWGGVFRLGLTRRGETTFARFLLLDSLGVSTSGDLLNVIRFSFDIRQRFTERFRFDIVGNVFYSTRERDIEEDDQVFSFQFQPALYYLITEDINISANYEYTFQEELDEPGSPRTQRNVAGIYLNLSFPQRWD